MRLRRIVPIASTLLAALCAPAAAQAAPTITEFPASASGPSAVARGTDGNVWFAAKPNPGLVGRVTPDGTVTTFQPPSRDGSPAGIADGPDGLWFAENTKNQIGRITTSGAIQEFAGGRSHDHPVGITAGLDGNMWFTATGSGSGAISRITPQGVVTE